jgi:hypothetical protein
MVMQPGAGGQAVVRGQVVGDDVDVSGGIDRLNLVEKLLVEGTVAGGGGHGDFVPVSY